MNRRELLGALVGLSAAATVKAAPARTHGLLTVHGHMAHKHATGEDLHVWVDGVELTGVIAANDVEGYADIFCQDQQSHQDWTAKGATHVASHSRVHDACKIRVTGHVVIAPGVTR